MPRCASNACCRVCLALESAPEPERHLALELEVEVGGQQVLKHDVVGLVVCDPLARVAPCHERTLPGSSREPV